MGIDHFVCRMKLIRGGTCQEVTSDYIGCQCNACDTRMCEDCYDRCVFMFGYNENDRLQLCLDCWDETNFFKFLSHTEYETEPMFAEYLQFIEAEMEKPKTMQTKLNDLLSARNALEWSRSCIRGNEKRIQELEAEIDILEYEQDPEVERETDPETSIMCNQCGYLLHTDHITCNQCECSFCPKCIDEYEVCDRCVEALEIE